MEKILNLQRGWKSRLWFGEKAFALCFVIFTAFTGLVSVNAGPGALYESHTFRTILNVMLTATVFPQENTYKIINPTINGMIAIASSMTID